MKRRLTLPAVLVLGLIAAADAAAQKPVRHVVVGTVTDSVTGAPVAGAAVTFGRDRTVFTDDEGRFTIARIDEGTQSVAVEELGYRPRALGIEVNGSTGPVAIQLAPDPVLLRGLAVIAKQFQRRMDATAMSVRAFDDRDLKRAAATNVRDFLAARGAYMSVPCPAGRRMFGGGLECVYSRGQVLRMNVYVDGSRLLGGLDDLATIPLSETYRVEVYQRGLYVDVFTNWWVAAHANIPEAAVPFF